MSGPVSTPVGTPGRGRRVTPGRMLDTVLRERGITQTRLAQMLAQMLDARQISELVRDLKPFTDRTAVLLELALGVPAEKWLMAYYGAHLPALRTELARQIAAGGRTAGFNGKDTPVTFAVQHRKKRAQRSTKKPAPKRLTKTAKAPNPLAARKSS